MFAEQKDPQSVANKLFQAACHSQSFRPPRLSQTEQLMLNLRPWEQYRVFSMPASHRAAISRLIDKGLLLATDPPAMSAAGRAMLELVQLGVGHHA